jgi:hypothetical protein
MVRNVEVISDELLFTESVLKKSDTQYTTTTTTTTATTTTTNGSSNNKSITFTNESHERTLPRVGFDPMIVYACVQARYSMN